MALTLAIWVTSQPGVCDCECGYNGGCVCLGLGVGGEVWAESMTVLVFSIQLCAYVCVCDWMQKSLHMSV